jgi:chitinase
MLMTYDYHELSRTSINAPLHRESSQSADMEAVAENVMRVLNEGCEPAKVVLGIPTYGRTYTLQDAEKAAVGAPVEGTGEAGPYTLSSGSLGFNEVEAGNMCCSHHSHLDDD